MRSVLRAILVTVLAVQGTAGAGSDLRVGRSAEHISIAPQVGEPLVQYWLKPPEESPLTVESAAFFHPLKTPSGNTVTELAPPDHPHHRGVFLGFVEVQGAADGDFWGWGEPAPVEGRRIEVRKTSGVRSLGNRAAFGVESAWLAGETVVLVERLQAMCSVRTNATILDLNYRLTPSEDTLLGQWAFSGFCVRTIREGSLTAHGPGGVVDFPDPNHLKPESDWPDADWYAFSLALGDGLKAGVAVVDHPDNPPTLWHNHRQTRMINPCIVAPGEVRLEKHKPLTLRYRVVAFDGAVPADLLNHLASDWQSPP